MAGLYSLLVMMAAASGLSSSVLAPALTLAMMTVVKIIERLMSGATMPVAKGKIVDPMVSLPFA